MNQDPGSAGTGVCKTGPINSHCYRYAFLGPEAWKGIFFVYSLTNVRRWVLHPPTPQALRCDLRHYRPGGR